MVVVTVMVGDLEEGLIFMLGGWMVGREGVGVSGGTFKGHKGRVRREGNEGLEEKEKEKVKERV